MNNGRKRRKEREKGNKIGEKKEEKHLCEYKYVLYMNIENIQKDTHQVANIDYFGEVRVGIETGAWGGYLRSQQRFTQLYSLTWYNEYLLLL